MAGPLSHVTILDLSRVLAGPWCTQNLADLGAEVIKVERPGRGDDTRGWGPPYLKDPNGRDTTESAYFLCANRGKKSITLDITAAAGQDIARRLAEQADVLVENYKVGGLVRYRLDYSSLRAVNPRLVYCSITGFGQDGPYAQRAGYDSIAQAMGGLMSITGEADERPGGGPQKVGVAVSDLMTGMYATVAVLAALAHRERSGEGQHIDLALLDSTVAMTANLAANYLTSGVVPQRMGNAHANIVPYQSFATADGHVMVAVGNDSQFARYCALCGLPELATDARFVTNRARVVNREELIALLAPVMRQRGTGRWVAELEAAGVPGGPINHLDEVFADPQVRHRGLRKEMPHPSAGRVPLVASPMRFSATPVEYREPPPLLGQHTADVLRDRLGMSAGDIDALRRAGVV